MKVPLPFAGATADETHTWGGAAGCGELTRMAARGREELERLFDEDARDRRSA